MTTKNTIYPWKLSKEELMYIGGILPDFGSTILIKETEDTAWLANNFSFKYQLLEHGLQSGAKTIFALFALNKNPLSSYKKYLAELHKKCFSTGAFFFRITVSKNTELEHEIEDALNNFRLSQSLPVLMILMFFAASRHVDNLVGYTYIEKYITEHIQKKNVSLVVREHLTLFVNFFIFKKNSTLYLPSIRDVLNELSKYSSVSIDKSYTENNNFDVHYLSIYLIKEKGEE